MAELTYGDRYDPFGLESPFSGGEAATFESAPWSAQGEELSSSTSPKSWLAQVNTVVANAGRTTPRADDPPRLADMLAIPGRFDDPKRDATLEFDGTRFGAFLLTRDRRQFAADWLSSHPALTLAASEPGADLSAGDIAKAWFIIHDIGVLGSVTDKRFQAKDPRNKKSSVHGFLNRGGYYAAINDFDKNKMGTVFEFLSKKGVATCAKTTINIETAPDFEAFSLNSDGSVPAPSNADRYASIGYRRLRKSEAAEVGKTHAYYKWATEAFDVLADLYILASIRAGHLLTVTAHKEVDRNLAKSRLWREYSAAEIRNPSGWKKKYLLKARDHPSDYHGDPYAFDMQAFYDRITAKLNALSGFQLPSGARYGVHPLRLRKPTGQDIGNGDNHLHEFPHQSDPVVKTDGNIKKDGWWKAAGSGESEDKARWSEAEWSASLAEASDFEAPDEENCAMCGMHEHDDETVFGVSEGLEWLDTQSEENDKCPHCGNEASSDEGWTDQLTNDANAFAFEDSAQSSTGTDLILREASGDFETSPAAASYALLMALPDSADYAKFVPFDYKLDAKAMVGKLSVDLKQLETPDAKEMASFAKDVYKFVGGGDPASMMMGILVNVLKNIPGGYLAAAANIADDWAARGFSRGVVLGADKKSKKYLIETFGHDYIPPNNAFAYGRKVAAANYGGGLMAGFVQGRALSKNQQAIFWRDLGRRMGDQSFRGASANWTDKQWQEWYTDVAASFRRYHLK